MPQSCSHVAQDIRPGEEPRKVISISPSSVIVSDSKKFTNPLQSLIPATQSCLIQGCLSLDVWPGELLSKVTHCSLSLSLRCLIPKFNHFSHLHLLYGPIGAILLKILVMDLLYKVMYSCLLVRRRCLILKIWLTITVAYTCYTVLLEPCRSGRYTREVLCKVRYQSCLSQGDVAVFNSEHVTAPEGDNCTYFPENMPYWTWTCLVLWNGFWKSTGVCWLLRTNQQ